METICYQLTGKCAYDGYKLSVESDYLILTFKQQR